ncbi:MerR family transcriptional regulator [Clostridium sp. PL3]|uniref:MerR family transcriptional regulator n=1 Tax=Clostridium thailandense TaxID=2794346 RepID=A0A949U387_9CLOT|nr:MerR family transcriptional regulator [Clostridium thailandense]MBV7275638.1 MerR family transcriptional regulator [Clostridium thailandense]
MSYSIGEFAKTTNLSIDTLRYYEKEGLIVPKRKENGRRIYCEEDITWIAFIKRLKETKMPIKEIQKYAKLRSIGDSTMIERMEMLVKHRTDLEKEINKANENLQKLNDKIDFYKSEIDKKSEFKFACI